MQLGFKHLRSSKTQAWQLGGSGIGTPMTFWAVAQSSLYWARATFYVAQKKNNK